MAVAWLPPKGSAPTDMELRILDLRAQGYTNAKVAKRLFLSIDMVKRHQVKLFARLDARSAAHAVARCYQLGYFTPEGIAS